MLQTHVIYTVNSRADVSLTENYTFKPVKLTDVFVGLTPDGAGVTAGW